MQASEDRAGQRFDWPSDDDRLGAWAVAALIYVSTSLIVFLGLSFGADVMSPAQAKGHIFETSDAPAANWDGQWYTEIATNGYFFEPDMHSGVAFFPAYPMLGRLVALATGLSCDKALVVVSNILLAATFILLTEYLRGVGTIRTARYTGFVLLSLGLIPTSFFFRVAYTESLFLCLTTLTFLGIRRRWPLLILTVVIGAATATRAVGVALWPALVWDLWRRSGSWSILAVRLLALTPVSCWGLLSYMAYLHLEFGDALAFLHAQASWRHRPPAPPVARLIDLVTLEPIRSLYDPREPGIRARAGMLWQSFPLVFTPRLADPVYFLGTVALVVVGATRRWLDPPELLVAAGLLAIPYATIGHEQYMQSMARYSSVVLPAYFVLGHILTRLPAPLNAALAGFGGFFLGVYSALFAAWHLVV